MEFNEILESLKSFEGSDEYEAFITGHLTNDRINAFLETPEGKAILQPRFDKHFEKSLKTWQTNNLDRLVDEKVKELYPDTDPKDAEVAKLKAEIANMKAEAMRKDLTNKALSVATEKGLPTKLVRHFIGKDEADTLANLEELETEFNTALSAMVTKKLGESHKPAAGDDGKRTLSAEELANMSIDEINAYFNDLKK